MELIAKHGNFATHFFAPKAQPKIGLPSKNKFKPQRGGRKIPADGSAVPAGLDAVFAQNPQLKLRAIFKRRFAADRSAGIAASRCKKQFVADLNDNSQSKENKK